VDNAETVSVEAVDCCSAGAEPAESTLLVVIMNSLADWEIVQTQGWYRLPLRRAPRQVAADYLAFYHTAAFEDMKWSVRHYAPVQKVSVVRRRDLLPAQANHPRAGDWYLRFDLGPLQALERPLLSRRLRRVTFIHTTMQRLLQAEDVAELWLTPPLRERLWTEFNRQGIHAEQEASLGEDGEKRLCDFIIPCYAGGVTVECGEAGATPAGVHDGALTASVGPERTALPGWTRLRFEDAGWPLRLEPYLQAVWEAIERHGGQL
jgi:hypothetical protein